MVILPPKTERSGAAPGGGAPRGPGMEQPPHPMRLGDSETDYYVQGPTLAKQGGESDPVGEQVR